MSYSYRDVDAPSASDSEWTQDHFEKFRNAVDRAYRIEQPDSEDDRVPITLDMAAFDAVRLHLEKAAFLIAEISQRNAIRMSGVQMAAEATVLGDIRHAGHDADVFGRYLGTMGGAV
jgi:hypothetical protein